MHSVYLRLFSGLVCLLTLVFGIKFSQIGFQDIQDFKQLERIVPTSLLGALPGENQLRGKVALTTEQNYLRSPKTQQPSIYYRYLVEREQRDSDGNTRWVTEQDISRSVDFVLYDGQVRARVYAGDWTEQIQWLLPKRFSQREGSRRYSEWRIEPDEALILFAWVDVENRRHELPDMSVRFDRPGKYLPIISSLSDAEIRSDMGNWALLKIWGGISLIALGLMALIYSLQIHRILVFLSLLTLVTTSFLFVYGLASLSSDVRGGAAYLQSRLDKSEQSVEDILQSRQLTWSGWQSLSSENTTFWENLLPWQQQRIQTLRLNLALTQAIYQQQISRFPENVYAALFVPDPLINNLALSATEQAMLLTRIQAFEPTKVTALAYWWILAGVVCFIGFTYFGFRGIKVKRMIENIPTSACTGVSVGLAEVQGKVVLQDEQVLKGLVSNDDCIWYRYLVEQKRGSGKNARWVKVSDDTQFRRFQCQDRDGRLVIDPEGADLLTRHKKVKRTGDMRYSEWLLKPGDELYALGMAKVDSEKQAQLVLGKASDATENSDLFILSNYSEKDLMIRKAALSMLSLSLAFSAMFCAAIFMGGLNGHFSATDYLGAGLLAPLFLIFFMLVLHYNDLVFLQRRALRNWANIQVSLKKRADLLPALQSIVSHYKDYENSLLEQIARQRRQLRTSLESAGQAGEFLKSEQRVINGLKLIVEDYPELKANSLFQGLMDTLTRLEDEIALMRTGYNDAVEQYNARIQSFPDLLLARQFKFDNLSLLS